MGTPRIILILTLAFAANCHGYARFAAGTMVSTPGGMKPIERLSRGDDVLSYRFPTAELRTHPVTRIESRRFVQVVELDLGFWKVVVHPRLRVWSASALTFKPVTDLVIGETLGMASWYWVGAISADRFEQEDRRTVRYSGPPPRFRGGTPAGLAQVVAIRRLESPVTLYGIDVNVADNILIGPDRVIFRK